MLQQAVDGLGGLHIAVTTAGGGIGERTIRKNGPHSLDSFRKTVDLNLIGTFNISRLAAWQMSKNEPEDEERGVIINTASIAAFEGQIGQVAYTASKAAIAGMCLTMARDLGRHGGVRQAGAGHRRPSALDAGQRFARSSRDFGAISAPSASRARRNSLGCPGGDRRRSRHLGSDDQRCPPRLRPAG